MSYWNDEIIIAMYDAIPWPWFLNNFLLWPRGSIASVGFLVVLVIILFIELIIYQNKLRPKIECLFSEKIAGCVRRDILTSINGNQFSGNYYRIMVSARGGKAIKSCAGNLISIKRNGETVFNEEPIVLPFAPNDGSQSQSGREIRPEVPNWIDFLLISQANQVIPQTLNWNLPKTINWGGMFNASGDYLFTVVISCEESVSVTKHLILHWGGDNKTAVLEDVSQ